MKISMDEYEKALELSRQAILKDGLIIFPTDTLYGLGANATSEKAVERVFEAKKRDSKPISIIVANLEMLKKYCYFDERIERFLISLLPGPYTVILKKRFSFPSRLASGESIGIRIPLHYFMLTLVKQLNFPITATSANLSGDKAPSKTEEINKEVAKKAELIIDGGECKFGEGSTIIDFTGEKVKIIREGAGLEKAKELLKLFKF